MGIPENYNELYSKIEYQKRLDEFQRKRHKLINEIELRLKEDISDDERNLVENIKNMPDFCTTEYNEKEWLWNNGYYRNNDEINRHNEEYVNKSYIQSSDAKFNQYQLLCVIPFLIWLLFIAGSKKDFISTLLDAFFTVIFPLMASCIISILASNLKIKEMNKHNYPKKSKEYIKESANVNAGKIGFFASCLSLFKHGRQKTKEIKNPDSWSDFK